jgi:hypothetical protein
MLPRVGQKSHTGVRILSLAVTVRATISSIFHVGASDPPERHFLPPLREARCVEMPEAQRHAMALETSTFQRDSRLRRWRAGT